MSFRRIIKPIVPPVLWNIGKDVKRRLVRSVDHYAYAPAGWDTKLRASDGNEAYWSTFVARERVLCEALIARVRAHHSILTPDDEVVKYVTFGYVLALAARGADKLTVLDYGGNLGEYYWIARALLSGVTLEYHCKELPAIAAAGRQLTPDIMWHTDDTCLATSSDVIMFAASLPYLRDWKAIVQRAARATTGYLLLSDVPSVSEVPTYVATQRSGGVTTLYQLLNRSEVIETVQQAGLRLVTEFSMGPHPPVANAPEQPLSAGWLFRK